MDTKVAQKLVTAGSTTAGFEVTKGRRPESSWEVPHVAEADAREVGIIAVLGELSWGQLAATVRSQVGWPRNGALCSCWRNAP